MEINQKLKVTGELADKVRQTAATEHRTLHNTMLVLIERGLKVRLIQFDGDIDGETLP